MNKQTIRNIAWNKVFGRYGIYIAFIVVCAIISIVNPVFLSISNLVNVLRQVSLIGITAIGVTFVILAADIDLSIGAVAALSGVLAVGLYTNSKLNLFLALGIALLVSAAIGLIMGAIITKGKVHSFVVTLGMLSIARGLALVYTKGDTLGGLDDAFRFIGGGDIWGIPLPLIFFIIISLIAYLILTRTPYGIYIYAIGGNQEATRLSGINVDLVRIVSFGICSLLAGFTGIMLAARVNSGQPIAAQGWELDAIAAAIIGGTSLYGGKGGVGPTIIGALFLGVIHNGLNLLNISAFYQKVVIGALIIIAVIIDSIRKKD